MNLESEIRNQGRRPCLRRAGGKASRYFNSLIHYSLFLILIAALALTGIRCSKGAPPEVREAARPVTLTWWRIFDDEVAVKPIIEAYRALHPNVTIQYRKLRFEDYERELLNTLAEDRGPDLFSIHNTWMRAYLTKLTPLPPSLTIPFQTVKGGLRKEVVTTLKTSPSLTLRGLETQFVDAVRGDVVVGSRDGQGQVTSAIYGLPLGLDTLAFYYNRDLLNLAGLPQPPQTWSEFQGAVKKLTRLDSEGKLVLSGAALGTSRNVERAADILALLMMQNGAEMIDLSGNAVFDRLPASQQGRAVPPGEEALAFYTDFANPGKEVYSWGKEQPPSLEAFVSGRTAFFFGYSYHLPLIRARAPRMNLGIARAPQIEGNPEINFANYWVEVVSKKSKNQQWAWDFIQFATKAEHVQSYLKTAGKPTALRALVAGQLEDLNVGTFAAQVLTAKSWYRGLDVSAAEEALRQLIDDVHAGVKPRDALRIAAQKVTQTLR